jgi:putative phosphoribosyl transferase
MAETLPLAATDVGELRLPSAPQALVVVAYSDIARDETICEALREAQFATFQIDLDAWAEPRTTSATMQWLTERLLTTATWLVTRPELANMPVGIFGSEMAGGAALAAAAVRPDVFRALVLCDGRPYLTGAMLSDVHAPTLLIVDGQNDSSVAMSQETMTRVKGIAELETVQGSPVSADDPETRAHVAQLARRWFGRFLA